MGDPIGKIFKNTYKSHKIFKLHNKMVFNGPLLHIYMSYVYLIIMKLQKLIDF